MAFFPCLVVVEVMKSPGQDLSASSVVNLLEFSTKSPSITKTYTPKRNGPPRRRRRPSVSEMNCSKEFHHDNKAKHGKCGRGGQGTGAAELCRKLDNPTKDKGETG